MLRRSLFIVAAAASIPAAALAQSDLSGDAAPSVLNTPEIVTPGEEQIAGLLGVDPALYTLPELYRMQSEMTQGDDERSVETTAADELDDPDSFPAVPAETDSDVFTSGSFTAD